MTEYYPEGRLYVTEQNNKTISTLDGMREAIRSGVIAEGAAYRFDKQKNLRVRFPAGEGIIPFEDGTDDPEPKEISVIACVGRPVCFKVISEQSSERQPTFLLSRRLAMEECHKNYCDRLQPGCVIDGTVTHIESFGCFVDIGCGITALLPTESICYSRIPGPDALFSEGMRIKCIVRRRDSLNRILLSHKELLGTFVQNLTMFSQFETTIGVVRAVKNYGIFIELAPNLTGLSEYRDGILPGDIVSVYIKTIVPEKLKVKLVIVNKLQQQPEPPKLSYYMDSDRLSSFKYSPEGCEKTIETLFV